MLLIVGWSSVVVWLNVRPRVRYGTELFVSDSYWCIIDYGCPCTHACSSPTVETLGYRALLANIAIGLLAVAVLTFTSKYLARAIVAGLRAILSKPPPAKGNGPERAR